MSKQPIKSRVAEGARSGKVYLLVDRPHKGSSGSSKAWATVSRESVVRLVSTTATHTKGKEPSGTAKNTIELLVDTLPSALKADHAHPALKFVGRKDNPQIKEQMDRIRTSRESDHRE